VGVVRGDTRKVQRREPPQPTVQRLVSSEVGATQLSLQVNEVAAGEVVPPHVHNVEEVLYVVTGRCQLLLDDHEHLLGQGDAAIVPPGVLHGFENQFAEPLRVVAALASAAPRTSRPG
jgi:quercetin dioxygenase-like cupin family protein